MEAAAFDVACYTEWPTVTVALQRPPKDYAEIDAFQERFIAMLGVAKSGAPGVPAARLRILLTLDGIVEATLDQILRAASFVGRVREYVPHIEATALVVSSDLGRGILEQIMAIAPLQSRHSVFDAVGPAREWLNDLQPV